MTNPTDDQIRITPDGDGFLLHLPEVTSVDTQVWAVDIGLTADGLRRLRDAVVAVSLPSVDRAAEERIEQAEADAEQQARNTLAVANERESYRKAWKDEQQRRVKAEAAVARVRRLHDALDEETALTSPDDEITRGAAARKIAAALDGWTDPAELRRLADETPAAQPEPDRATLLALVRDFLDPDPCSFDHHGYCQAHGYLGGEPMSCPHGQARKPLAALEQPAAGARQGGVRPSAPPV